MTLEMGHRQGINTDLPVTMTTSWTFLEQPQSTQEQSTRIENTSIETRGLQHLVNWFLVS